ncbi:hypothetical protein [Mesorhizobium amorphae]|uniref:hypothetical protein n=1 Tax=Mesorhizobium amorphae TaxID=71433 RepID=UPI001FF079E9|nr:hypothetical protein [Mesorhizobium amorphae]
MADAVQQQAVDVERLYVLYVESAVWLQDENDAESIVAGSQPRRKSGRLRIRDIQADDDHIRPMALHLRESVCGAVALRDDTVSGLPQNPLKTGEIDPPRVRNNQSRHANTVRKKRNELI